MIINGKEVKLQVDFGAMLILRNEKGIDYLAKSTEIARKIDSGEIKEEDVDKMEGNMELTAGLIFASANRWARANDKDEVTDDDILSMKPYEYAVASVELTRQIMEFNAEPEKQQGKQKPVKNVKGRN